MMPGSWETIQKFHAALGGKLFVSFHNGSSPLFIYDQLTSEISLLMRFEWSDFYFFHDLAYTKASEDVAYV